MSKPRRPVVRRSAYDGGSLHAFTLLAAGTTLVGVIVAGVSVVELIREHAGLTVVALMAATIVASRFPVEVAGQPIIFPASQVLSFAALLLLGPGAATLTVAVDRASSWFGERPRTWRAAFELAVPMIAIWVAGHVLYLGFESRMDVPVPHAWPTGIAGVAMAATYFGIRSCLLAAAAGFEDHRPALKVWQSQAAFLAVTDYATLSVAMLVVAQGANSRLDMMGVGGLLMLMAYATYQTLADRVRDGARRSEDLEQLYQAAIETLAVAVDAKDQVTHGHIRRVQRHALAVAGALGIRGADNLKALEAAALLHDIGKLGVPDYVLNKPGSLTRSEFDLMKLHAHRGAVILSGVAFPFPVVPIVRHHHEQWNGGGYPDGLSGEDIPIGARLLSVVDCFDALTSDRPYRRKLTDAAAIEILRERSGSHYDPAVVETFVRLIPALRAQDRHVDAPLDAADEPMSEAPPRPLEGTQTLKVVLLGPESIGKLLRVRMEKLLPDARFCLWIPDERGERLRPVHVSRSIASMLCTADVRVGTGLAGWVAANRHTIINSSPDLDLHGGVGEGLIKKCVCTPVFAFGTIAGVLAVYTGYAEGFSEREVRVIGAIAQEIGVEFARHDRELVYDFTPIDEALPSSKTA